MTSTAGPVMNAPIIPSEIHPPELSTETPLPGGGSTIAAGTGHVPSYVLRPPLKQKFRPSVINKWLNTILQERLKNATYHPDTASQWTKEIADEIKTKLKDANYPRYKYIVHVLLGEKRGEGVNMAARCFYDSDTDNKAQATFVNDSLFCVAVGKSSLIHKIMNK